VTRHVDAETLARYRDGDLHGWHAWRVRAHLARCPECSDVNADLAQVTALLASVPEPPMPDYLSARIQGALAHEASLRAASAPARPATVSASSAAPASAEPAGGADRNLGRNRHQRSARELLRRWSGAGSQGRLRLATAAVALVVVVAGGYEIAVHAGGSSSPSPSSAPRAAPAAGAPVSYGPPLSYEHSGQANSVKPITTNTDFTASKLTSEVSGLSRYEQFPSAGPNHAVSPAVPTTGPTFRSIPVAAMSGCVNRIADGALVLLVDIGKFQGTPAWIIITDVSQTGPKQIWVVSTGCSASRSDILDHAVLAAGS
jgi:anti-sigma factor ChrR (cupin superfamily)